MSQSLRARMAAHGFESNEDYEFQIRCLLNAEIRGIRCLNVEGEAGRHRTAFANALAQALDYPHILYHDFTQTHPPLPEIILPPSQDETGREEPPIEPFDDIMSQACAFSDGAPTLLILDQLQAADFREHIRVFRFLSDAQWDIRGAPYYANANYLLVLLISEQPLYHSLQKASYRIWVDRVSQRQVPYQPEDFGLGEDALELMARLAELFANLGMAPTLTEYRRLLHDLEHQVRTIDHLCRALYAWVEGLDRHLLYSDEMKPILARVIAAIEDFVGVSELEIHLPAEPENLH